MRPVYSRYYVIDMFNSIYGTASSSQGFWYVSVWDTDEQYLWEHNCIPNGYRILTKEEMEDI